MTDISLCDVVGSWLPAPTLDSTYMIQGAGCMSIQAKAVVSALSKWAFYASVATTYRLRSGGVATITTAVHGLSAGNRVTIRGLGGTGYNGNWVVVSAPTTTTFTYTNAGSDEGSTADTGGTVRRAIDMTGQHIYAWMLITGIAMLKSEGGYRIYAETSASDYGTWYVGGRDTHPGGWGCFVISPASTPTTPVGTVDAGYITQIGVQFYPYSTALGSIKNCLWDAVRYGTGLTITSGAADAIDFEDIYNADMDAALTYRWGVVNKGTGGVYTVQGLLTFGGTGAENIDFLDKSQIVIFPDNTSVSSSFYGIRVLAGSGVVNFTLGEKSGTAGIKGCLLKAPGTKTFSLDVSSTAIDIMQLYGCSFNNAGVITLPPTAANREVLNCSFEAGAGVVISTCIVTNCNFISSDAEAILMSSVSHNTTYCNFIACPVGVKLDTYNASPYTFNALIFTNSTFHVNNTSGQTLTVGKSNGSNPSTYTGSLVTFTGSVVLKIVVKDEAGAVMVGVRTYIDDQNQSPYILDTTTDSNGEASTTYTGSPVTNATWRVRKYGYKPFEQLVSIGSDNITLPVSMVVDPIVP